MPLSRRPAPNGATSPRVRALPVYRIWQFRPNSGIDPRLQTRKNGAMSEFEIKGENGRFTLPSAEALVSAVRSGRLGRTTPVRRAGSESWTAADQVPEVAALFSDDVWSAWESDADDTVLDAFQVPEVDRPRKPLAPAPTIPPGDEVRDLPAAAVAPVDDEPDTFRPAPSISQTPITPASTTHPSTPSAPRRPPAKVIEFPQPNELRSLGSVALKPKLYPTDEARKPSVRWGRIAAIGGVCASLMMLWVWYVNMNATADFAPRAQTVGETVASIPPIDERDVPVEVSPYETLEDELRDQLMEGLLDIPGEGEFEDALLIELRRVRVDVRSVRVKILSWAGRRQDLPDQVGFNLKVVARDGELDRDLGALGLVMGKYIQHYGLQAVELNIILSSDDGLRKLVMDPEVARRYFTHRVSLERFLQSAFSGA